MSHDELKPHWDAAGYRDFSKGIIDESTFWRQFGESLGKPLNIDTTYVWSNGSATSPFPALLAFTQELKDKGILTAVLSNTVKPLSESLRKTGAYNTFDVAVLSDEAGLAKPDRSIYELAVSKLGVLPEECIYIDDINKNVEPAREMGMSTILADDNPEHTISRIRALL